MSMFKKIKRLFIEETEQSNDEKTEMAVKSDEELIEHIPDIENAAEEIEAPLEPSGKVDKKSSAKFVDILLKAIDDNNGEGFDYLEFKSALQNLSSMDMDENTKYKSALAMAKTMGVTPEYIIQSANRYLGILGKEETKFKNAVQRQRKMKVTDKEQEIVDRKKLIEAKTKKIEQLKADIEKEKETLERIKNNINKEAAKVQATYDNFLDAYGKVSGQIQKDIQNLSQHISSN